MGVCKTKIGGGSENRGKKEEETRGKGKKTRRKEKEENKGEREENKGERSHSRGNRRQIAFKPVFSCGWEGRRGVDVQTTPQLGNGGFNLKNALFR